ncbi:ABC transporter permease [Lampropedia aestuarii]|uniref:ABC transporter permease n=1 Tax=Lampropedia aestuarii TaxID=2562762 RepID=A0A4V3YWC7_9BURK|nr:ABC transporter permease [Lampropedia aestuarii]THJ30812.1 ABC transporter permease [Lampropedia aestuarii]
MTPPTPISSSGAEPLKTAANALDTQALAALASLPAPNKHAAWKALLRNPSALAGIALLGFVTFVALFANVLFPGDPLDMVGMPLAWPGQEREFFLGTDSLGRNVAAGLAHGARVSLSVGAVAASIALTIGVLVGAIGGYFSGWVDDVLVRFTELIQTVPTFLLVIVIVAIGQPSVNVIVFAIGAASWPVIARLVRAEFRSLREAEFVLAARSQGFGDSWIIFREILPNALPPVVVTTSVLVATAILMESALSFLGMGDPNVVSWGSMIGEGRELLRTAWYLTAVPGVAIILTVLSLNLVGDGINDAFNPRLRGRS